MGEVETFNPVEYFDTVPELVDNAYNRIRRQTLKTMDMTDTEKITDGLLEESTEQYQEMYARLKRARQLDTMRQKLQVQRHLQGKGKRVKVQEADGEKPAVFKWKRQRLK